MNNWIKFNSQNENEYPEIDQVVFWRDGERIWIGLLALENHPVEECMCQVVTRCYDAPYFSDGKWTAGDAESDDDYKPTHWQPFPVKIEEI